MRWSLLLALLALLPLYAPGQDAAQYTLYTCMVTSKGYVVGAKLPPSGLFLKPDSGAAGAHGCTPVSIIRW